ncbi:unnamed protein product, partial [Protopolystoma xenopodis]
MALTCAVSLDLALSEEDATASQLTPTLTMQHLPRGRLDAQLLRDRLTSYQLAADSASSFFYAYEAQHAHLHHQVVTGAAAFGQNQNIQT